MSLYNRMLNTNTVTVKEAAYGHEEGSFAIAMESAQELYQIFRESTYEAEQEELKALNEGVVLEGSQYEVVKENAIKKGFNKIVEFLKKLWAKVKAFFANVVKFLDGIFKSGKDFATKYEKDLLALGNKLDGFEYKMYKYNHTQIDAPAKDMDSLGEILMNEVESEIKNIKGGIDTASNGPSEKDDYGSLVKRVKDSSDEAIKGFRKGLLGVTDEEDQSEAIFKTFRNGAINETDKADIKVDIRTIIKILKDSKPDNFSSSQSKVDGAYKKAINFIETKAKEAEKLDGKQNSAMGEMLRVMSSSISAQQTILNACINGGKTAFSERATVYKQVCLAAFRYKKDK